MDNAQIKAKALDFFKNNKWGLLLISVILGIIATLLAHFYIRSKLITLSGGKFIPVVAAVGDIDSGTVISEDMLSIKNVPSTLVHTRAVPEEYKDFLIGQSAGDNIGKGEVVLWSDIALEEPTSLSAKVGINERAITINVDPASGINGLIRPGDRVDVLASFDIPGDVFADTQSVTKVLLQNVTVLAVGEQMSVYDYSRHLGGQQGGIKLPVPEMEKAPSTITLKVGAEDAGILAFAERKGNILLVLRNKEDVLVEPKKDIKFKDVVTFKSVKEAPGLKKEEGYPLIYQDGMRIGDGYSPPSGFGSSQMTPIIPNIQQQIQQLMQAGALEDFMEQYSDQIDRFKKNGETTEEKK